MNKSLLIFCCFILALVATPVYATLSNTSNIETLSSKDDIKYNRWHYDGDTMGTPIIYNVIDEGNIIITLSLSGNQCDISQLSLDTFYKSKTKESNFEFESGASLKFNDRLFSAPFKATKKQSQRFIHMNYDLTNVHRPTFFDYLNGAETFSIFWIDTTMQASSLEADNSQFESAAQTLIQQCAN